jgi:alpha-tubulin suppressor-like RCC1 family protein
MKRLFLLTIVIMLGLPATHAYPRAGLAGAPSQSSGTVLAWGANVFGQLGDGSMTNRSMPVAVSDLSDVVSVAAGDFHSLALKADGTLWAWGFNRDGQLGDGSTIDHITPRPAGDLVDVVAIAAYGSHNLALKVDGTVWAWGANESGELGDGSTTSRTTPVRVSGLAGVVAIAAGRVHSLALKADGTIWAWGANYAGQLGDGSTTSRTMPVQVSALTGMVAIAAGSYHSLALKADGTIWAWGDNRSGRLGDGSVTNRTTPVPVSGLTGAVAMAGGWDHSLALKADGTVWAWGRNSEGQLGDGSTTSRSIPGQVSGLTGVTAIGAGGHSVALKADGTVWAWGDNSYGAVGDGSTTNRTTPVPVSGLAGVIAIAADGHNLALARPLASLSPDRLDFGNQPVDNTSATRTVTVANHGSEALIVSDIALTGGDAAHFDFTADGLPISIAPGGSTTIEVHFAPKAAGSRSAALTISDNAVGSPHSVALSGMGIADGTPPSVTIDSPIAATTYALNQVVPASYSCTDEPGGSGVASCAGPVASGSPIDTATVGSKTFTVQASDNAGNTVSQSVMYTVAYNICALYDQSKSHKLGSTVPIKLQLCDASGSNMSSSSVAVHSSGLKKVDSTASTDLDPTSAPNPDSDFRYDATLGGTGGYIYNLSTKNLTTGTWALSFTAGSDPTAHTIRFDVR